MEKSELYNLLETKLLQKWKEETEENDDCKFLHTERKVAEELKLELSEKNKKLFALYSSAIENRIDYVYFNLNIRILNLGIKIGMDLQKAFSENDE